MKKMIGFSVCLFFGIALSLGSTGCTTKEKDKDKKKPSDVSTPDKTKDKKIEVAADPTSWTGKPGEKATVKLKLTRGKDASKEATFAAAVEGKGVTAKLESDKIAGDKSEDTMTVTIADDAAKGEATVTVTVKSEGSPDASATVKVKVEEKKAAVVDPPAKDMKLAIADGKAVMAKQGDKKTEAKVAVTLGKDLKGVTFKAEVKGAEKAKGVEVKVGPEKMDASGDAVVTIMVADDATAGDFTITITAAAEGAMPASAASKIVVTVAAKK
jgi:uncharacterized membrane protein